MLGYEADDKVRFINSHWTNDPALTRLNEKLQKDLKINTMFGCTTKETGLFKTQYADGILGLDNDSSMIDSMESSLTKTTGK